MRRVRGRRLLSAVFALSAAASSLALASAPPASAIGGCSSYNPGHDEYYYNP